MNRSFHIPARLHPGYSLLGRWLRARAETPWAAESRLIVLLALGFTSVLVAAQMGWSLGWASLPHAAGFTFAALALLCAVGLLGRQPGVTATCKRETLHLRRGNEPPLVLPYEAIEGIDEISPLRYHRHDRRRPGAHRFVNRIPDAVLRLDTAYGPVVIGLSAEDRAALVKLLRRQRQRARPLEPLAG